jgi:hypothetical protein
MERFTIKKLNETEDKEPMLGGSLSPQHGMSSGCRWRDGLQLWKVAANIMNKQQQTTRGGPPAWG